MYFKEKKNEGHDHRAEKGITIQDRKKTMTKKQAENCSYPKVMWVTQKFPLKMHKHTSVAISSKTLSNLALYAKLENSRLKG